MSIRISRDFKIAVRMADKPAWQIAIKAGVHPNVLSKIMSGALPIRKGDDRVLRIARVLGLSERMCFEEDDH
jgi:hypothetical protein